MSPSAPVPPSGWYPDPAQPGRERYWDGARWTQIVRQAAVVAVKAEASREKSADPALDLPLAGWWRRFGSGVADTVIAWALTIVVLMAAAPGYLPRLASGYMAYSAQVQQSLLGAGSLPMPPDALTQQVNALLLAVSGVTVLYCTVFLGTWGATLGHSLCGIKVIRAPLPPHLLALGPDKPFAEEKPGWLRSISKGLSWALFSAGGGFFVLVQLVNMLLPLWHRRKQSVTDLFANTLTVRARPPAG